MIRQVILEQGMQQGQSGLLSRLIAKKFHLPSDNVADSLHDLRLEDLAELGEYLLDCELIDELQEWIHTRRQGNLS